jgi:acetyltransferase-like isoleucine patch superfamily enzyme
VGADCNIGDHAFIESGARLGDRVTVKNAVLVWDRVVVEDDAFLGPNAVFTNDARPRSGPFKRRPDQFQGTRVRKGATVGANATIVCGISLGEYCFVAAGAVVTADVAPHALVAGSPARRIGWVCACGEGLDDSLTCTCGRRYRPGGAEGGLESQ